MRELVIGILAHVDAGKTTLSEAILYSTGTIRSLGRVDHRDAFLDTEELERERGITIYSKQAVFQLGKREVTLLDTPGHVDFSAEMERVLQALDCAVLVVSGAGGVQAHTLTLWRLLEKRGVPVFLFVNKMDLAGTDRAALLEDLRARLGENCIDFSGSREAMLAFCLGIQAAAPVDSYVTPEPWAMPGYDSEVVMAAGAFVQGSSIELSADGPIRPPYAVYFQGGLTWQHAKLGILMSLQKLLEAGLVKLPE